MQPDTSKIWTAPEVRESLGKILVESLGVDGETITNEASLIGDLGAESIDFLDISFKCQHVFGVDLPARLIQERVLEWRDMTVVANVLGDSYGMAITGDELRTIAPATIGAVLAHVETKHGVPRVAGDEAALAEAVAARLLRDLNGGGLDLSDLPARTLAAHLIENLHSPAAMDEVMRRFTVRALADYVTGRLAGQARLATGT
jgi:acyl carrier protein